MEDFLKAAIPKIPTLAGVKFTSGDMFDLGRCLILEDQRFSIMFGGDEVIELFTCSKRKCLLTLYSLKSIYRFCLHFLCY